MTILGFHANGRGLIEIRMQGHIDRDTRPNQSIKSIIDPLQTMTVKHPTARHWELGW
jgi:hypothetical protein